MLALFLATGCKPKAREITSLQRKEAANLASEQQFALSVHDYARAEDLMTRATELCPDTGKYWIDLGGARVRRGNKSGAKPAYESGLAAYQAAARAANPPDAQLWLQQVYVLGLLGRVDEARAALADTQKRFPDNRNVRLFADQGAIDKMLADPLFKAIAL